MFESPKINTACITGEGLEMNKLDRLIEKRRVVVASLFLFRCLIAWAAIAAFYLFDGSAINLVSFVIYIVGIPAGLTIYDRFVLR